MYKYIMNYSFTFDFRTIYQEIAIKCCKWHKSSERFMHRGFFYRFLYVDDIGVLFEVFIVTQFKHATVPSV